MAVVNDDIVWYGHYVVHVSVYNDTWPPVILSMVYNKTNDTHIHSLYNKHPYSPNYQSRVVRSDEYKSTVRRVLFDDSRVGGTGCARMCRDDG